MVQQQMMEGRLSKREQKHNKILQKELHDLHRDVEEMNRRAGDRHNNDSDSDDDFADRKGKKWWSRFDERHFAAPTQQECQHTREITTSRRILQISPTDSPLASYAQLRILSEYELFAEPALVHVLFRASQPTALALTSYELEQAIPNYAENKRDREAEPPFKVTPAMPNNHSDPAEFREIKLSLAGINDDLDFCRIVEEYKRTLQLFPDKNKIEREMMLWEQELTTVNRDNNRAWDRLIKSVKQQVRTSPASESQIASIKQYLMWVTVLKYFQHGHADKTMDMLLSLIENQKAIRPAKSNDSNNKKLFETDCKICFCSFNNDSNQVLYCDNCNTSFHLACYGLQQIPKEEIYYCDCCRYQKKFNYKKVACQLCNKSNFPIKQLDGHFYHVTCLLLLNLARIRNGSLMLREDVNHHRITEMVVSNELQRSDCEFCSRASGSEIGYRLKCSFPNCSNSSHPICAYINGCKYSIKRDKHSERLEVRYHCNEHDPSRDWQQQTYIRRYMCNLKGTSSKNVEEFRREFLQSIQKKRENRTVAKKWDAGRIIGKTKMLKRFFEKEESKNSQKGEKLDTESGRILEKFYKKGR